MASVLAPLSFFSLHDFPALPNAPQIVRLTRLTPWAGRALLAMARRITGPWVAPVVAMRAELGLPPAGDPLYEGQFSPYGNLALFSRALGDAQPDWPPRTHGHRVSVLQPRHPDAGRADSRSSTPASRRSCSRWARRRSTPPARSSTRAPRRRRALGARAVLLVGPNPANRPAVPSTGRSPWTGRRTTRCSRARRSIVHQGGVGTTGQAMRSGRPELIVPFAHDQPDNAFRVQQLGAARVLYPPPLPRRPRRPRAGDAADDARATPRPPRQWASACGAERGAVAAVDAILATLAIVRR